MVLSITLKAQDIHFTQWMHAPHVYSPASIGDFDGLYRFHGNYRNQWASVTVPFVTFSTFAESNVLTPGVTGLSSALGVTYDVTGDSKFSTTHIQLGAGYEIPFIPDSIGNVRIGLLPSLTQKKIDIQSLRFDNQYNGFFFDGSLSSQEQLPRLSRWYFDLALGLQYDWQVNNQWEVRVAGGAYNLLSPKQSFFNNNDIRLDRRYSLQADAFFAKTKTFAIQPGVQFSNQGTYYSVNFGSLFLWDFSKSQYFQQRFFAGAYFRAVDSGNIIAGVDYGNWRVAASYDINYSGLVPASNYRGSFELAVVYIIPPKIIRPKYKVCPDY